MKRLEKFLVMLSLFALVLHYAGDRKMAGLLILSLLALALFYAAGSYFLLREEGSGGILQVVGVILCGIVMGYGILSLLRLATGKMTGIEAVTDNSIFLGMTILAAIADLAGRRRPLGRNVLWRVVPLLLAVLAAARWA